MNAPDYTPSPIDTSRATLGHELAGLTEQLAENAHDLWALERQKQGWHHGSRRDDETKEHPCLVPYNGLPETEKEFDRQTVLGTLKAIIALGYKIEPSESILAPGHDEAVKAWQAHLEAELTATRQEEERAWTFDADDQPEIAFLKDSPLSVTREVLKELQAQVHGLWESEDATAQRKQKWHGRIAAFAIWPGILAIVFAILQLTADHLYADHDLLPTGLSWLELICVAFAAFAVAVGFAYHLHHGWLSHRQRAERLRSLKFSALSWPELWCDFDEWKKRLASEVAKLKRLTTHSAHEWAKKTEDLHPFLPQSPSCVVPQADLQALSLFYRIKRLQFQRNYFHTKALAAHKSSWIVDCKLGLWLFSASVAIVLIHGVHHFLPPHQAVADQTHAVAEAHGPSPFDLICITLAALLPVLGFGFRAWLAAFEAPRSRNLFRAKALALDDYIARSSATATNVKHTLHQIAQGEHFFINEHREWCRLQMEAEWFV